MFLVVLAEEGPGIIYLSDYYWSRARKHVAVIFIFDVVTIQRWGIFAAEKLFRAELNRNI